MEITGKSVVLYMYMYDCLKLDEDSYLYMLETLHWSVCGYLVLVLMNVYDINY